MYLDGAVPLTGFFGQPIWARGRDVGDEHPVEEPGPAAPAWAALPTMPWTRVVTNPRHSADAGVSSAVAPAEEAVEAAAPEQTRPRLPGPPCRRCRGPGW